MKKIIFILCIAHYSLLIANCFAQQPTEQWVARYNSPHSINDRFEGMAVDKLGNSYVTGWNTDSTTGNDIITAKINNAGQIVWSRTYNSGGPGSNELGKAIAVDNSGNVYVTGFTGLNTGPYDIITIKYDVNGNTVWAKIYDSGGTESAYAIKIDNADNVYITGGTNNGTVLRAITIKYNPVGDTVWIMKFTGGNNSSSYCLDIDSFNNIYIGGSVQLTNWMSMVIKYNSSGTQLWSNIYNTGYTNTPYSIAVDSSGNGAVTGAIVFTPSSYGDYYTVRFTNDGNTLWQRYFNGPDNFTDIANAVAIDVSSNVYITGYSGVGGVNSDYVTIKYNLQGDTLWTKRYDGPANDYDESFSICLDTSGNCYVTGASVGSGSSDDYTTIKYNASGVQKWVVRYNGPANGGDGAGSVIMGSNNTLYVGGESWGIGTGLDLAVVKYDQLIGILNNTNEMPVEYKLFQNYPNPFNSTTVITYALPKRSFVKLVLYNSIGELVKEIVNGNEEAGYYTEILNLDNFSSGIYFYKISAGDITDTKKMILIK
ncbi:MAG: T9SS type A sorting domain-containing protein [Ignavibacteria bacterium]